MTQPPETENRIQHLEQVAREHNELLLGIDGKLGLAHKVRLLWVLLPAASAIIGALLSWVLRDFLK
jgi:hypothetical protein